jgi:uncharacterized membrane protein YhaH (DUF805 family)
MRRCDPVQRLARVGLQVRGAKVHRGGAVAALLAVGGIALLGIPGAVVYGVSAPVVQLMLGARFHSLNEDVWPAAIITTLTWPASLVVAYALANGPLRRRGRGARWAALVLVPYAVGVALTLWAHLSM